MCTVDRSLLCTCVSRSPCEVRPVSTVEISRQVENHSCHIDGVTYTFAVHSAAMLPCSNGLALLQVGGYRHDVAGATLIARMRITAALPELERVPALLTKALEAWLVAPTLAPAPVH